MRIIVDQDRCVGHGRCYDLAPEVFDADEDGYVALQITGDIPEELRSDAELAVLNCPERTLAIKE